MVKILDYLSDFYENFSRAVVEGRPNEVILTPIKRGIIHYAAYKYGDENPICEENCSTFPFDNTLPTIRAELLKDFLFEKHGVNTSPLEVLAGNKVKFRIPPEEPKPLLGTVCPVMDCRKPRPDE